MSAQPATDAEALATVMPAEQVLLFQAAREAVLALAAARGEQDVPLDTLWWLFAAPMRVTKATYASFFGTKEVWTVVIEHPAHIERPRRRADR